MINNQRYERERNSESVGLLFLSGLDNDWVRLLVIVLQYKASPATLERVRKDHLGAISEEERILSGSALQRPLKELPRHLQVLTR